jgi:hypothetical protein
MDVLCRDCDGVMSWHSDWMRNARELYDWLRRFPPGHTVTVPCALLFSTHMPRLNILLRSHQDLGKNLARNWQELGKKLARTWHDLAMILPKHCKILARYWQEQGKILTRCLLYIN